METNNQLYKNQAEMALIGSMINDYSIISDVKVNVDDFYVATNQELFEAVKTLGERVNIVTLQDVIGSRYDMGYVNQCISLAYTTTNFKHFEDIIIKYSVLRKQVLLAQEIISNSMAGNDSSTLFKQSDTIDTYDDGELVMIGDIVGEELDAIERYQKGEMTQGLMTRVKGLDHLANGLVNGDLIYIGARPSMGKSAFANQLALNIAAQGKKVAIFSLEMQNAKIVKRMLVNQARVHLNIIKERKLEDSSLKKLTNASAKLYQQNIALSDKGSQRVGDILRKSKRHKKLNGLDVLIIDHFHLLKPTVQGSNYEKRSFDSQLLKEMAKELDIPVICLCQLSRGLEQRSISDRMPILSDLKETGSLEQDGDLIMFINREDYWHKNEPDYTNNHIAEISVAKNRDGEIGNFKMNWSGGTQRFDEL